MCLWNTFTPERHKPDHLLALWIRSVGTKWFPSLRLRAVVWGKPRCVTCPVVTWRSHDCHTADPWFVYLVWFCCTSMWKGNNNWCVTGITCGRGQQTPHITAEKKKRASHPKQPCSQRDESRLYLDLQVKPLSLVPKGDLAKRAAQHTVKYNYSRTWTAVEVSRVWTCVPAFPNNIIWTDDMKWTWNRKQTNCFQNIFPIFSPKNWTPSKNGKTPHFSST